MKERDALTRSKYNPKTRLYVRNLLLITLVLGNDYREAYRLKTLFNDLWTIPSKEAASAFLNQWYFQNYVVIAQAQ
jgi:hypothetical protein